MLCFFCIKKIHAKNRYVLILYYESELDKKSTCYKLKTYGKSGEWNLLYGRYGGEEKHHAL